MIEERTQVKYGIFPEQEMPMVIQPRQADVLLSEWVQENANAIEAQLIAHGALLFRGFQASNAQTLEGVVTHLASHLVNYVEGSSPRLHITEKVYTSTEYPPEFDISMHNELSYAHRWPSKLFFLCLTAPQNGGETPIADSRKILQRLDPSIIEVFSKKGVKYVRHLNGGRGVGLSWQTVFETENRMEVERYCNEGEIHFEWTRSGGLRTSQVRPAIIKHPKTGEMVWFNQADQWHPTNLPENVQKSMLSVMKEKDLPINAYFGDGSPIDAAILDEIRRVSRQTAVKFPWQEGDMLLVDNTMVSHGRAAFSGPRKVAVAMGGVVHLNDVDSVMG